MTIITASNTGVVVDGLEITDLSTINNAGVVYLFTKDGSETIDAGTENDSGAIS
ncbi:hypothetical protein [Vibrio mimicus]|uniref:hypothetical protein n=1 Tax=Vibrio mimicus TaxID=674 RepID=UPI00165267EA|nr:hypothetical protein [Vibrio mimicus]